MSFNHNSASLIEYSFCDYGTSKAIFRGPEAEIGNRTVSFIGAAETFGRFVLQPFPQVFGSITGRPAANLGQISAGIDRFILNSDIVNICQRSAITVVQVMGAQNMSNRMYSVHPRRNDRFIRPSALIQTIFNDIEFTDFNFNQHMLSTLKAQAPDRFPIVVQELQAAWLARMRMMLSQIGGDIILLWIPCRAAEANPLGKGPLFITEGMIDELRPALTTVVRPKFAPDVPDRLSDGLIYSPFDQAAAELAMTQSQHDFVADLLIEAINNID